MSQIQDFGRKIGGARKDAWKKRGLSVDDTSDWTAYERAELIKKGNVWPKPDYQAMFESGLSKRVVFFIKKIRDSVPAKPSNNTEEYQDGYISFVSDLRDKTMALKTEQEVLDYYEDVMKSYVTRNGRYFVPKPETYECLTNRLFKAAQIGGDFYYIDNAIRKKLFLYTPEEKALSDYDFFKYEEVNARWETNYAGRTVLGLSDSHGISYFYPVGDDAVKENWEDETFFVAHGNIVGKNFETLDEAKEYALSVSGVQQPQASTKKRKKKFTPKQLENVDRVGESYRDGDVTGDDMLEVFGFYGGEFGNWLNDKDRQANLNFSYDAFCDLARALNISNEDISLNGELAIAFGSRGRAGASAHYEPARRVINLTKMTGAGSLAHEWAHALDHYLGREVGNTDDFLTDSINAFTRPLKDAMRFKIDEDGRRIKTDFYENSIEFDKHYTKDSKRYWQSNVEMFARAFACYVSDKLRENGEKNDYLCGHADSCVIKTGDGTIIKAYPEGEERQRINACFDDLIEKARQKGLLSEYQREPLVLEDAAVIDEHRRDVFAEFEAMAANIEPEHLHQASFDFDFN